MSHGDQTGPIQLTLLGTLSIGNLQGRLVADPAGRRCLELKINNQEVLFTVGQMLLFKRMFDVALDELVTFIPAPQVGE